MPVTAGWNYILAFFEDQDIEPVSCRRSDGRELILPYNLWIQPIEDNNYLQIVDYFSSNEIGTDFLYTIAYTKTNRFKPRFERTTYSLNVSENAEVSTELFKVTAIDNDEHQTITYKFDDTSVQPGLISINPSDGSLHLIKSVDRETTDYVALTVVAVDDGTPPRSSSAGILITILDENDNSPVIHGPEDSILRVEETVPIGHTLFQLSTDDADIGQNGLVEMTLGSNDLFTLSESGSLETSSSLIGKIGEHNLIITATDQGKPVLTSTLGITVTVNRQNQNAPQFDQGLYTFSIDENVETGSELGTVQASDQDEGVDAELSYSLNMIEGFVPFDIDINSGLILTTGPIDRETVSEYSFEVLAEDNGSPPTGRRNTTALVKVTVNDKNDHRPSISIPEVFSIAENTQAPALLFEGTISDPDEGNNGEIKSATFLPGDSRFDTKLQGQSLTVLANEVFDYEIAQEHKATLILTDNGTPPLVSEYSIVLQVTDENDNPPEFVLEQSNILVQRSLIANSIIGKLNATDADRKGNLTRNIIICYTDSKWS